MSCSFLFPICVVRTDCQCAGNAAAVSANRSAASGLGKVCRRTVSVCAGAVKKVLLADTFGKAVDAGYGNVAGLSGTDAWLVMLFYTLQLYFDFSGYCDMGRGIAHMLGMELPVNFDSPYKASNLIEFWKRWHITLNRFLRKYVYIPLGGNRKGTARMYLNLFIVFLVSGIWHGAGWNFVLWGALHGALYLVTRAWQRRQPWQRKQPRQQCAADVHVQSGTKNPAYFLQSNMCFASL